MSEQRFRTASMMSPSELREIAARKSAQSAQQMPDQVQTPGVAAVAAGSESEAVNAMRREVREAWSAARDADGQTAAYRILERMVERVGYGRYDNPPLSPNKVDSTTCNP